MEEGQASRMEKIEKAQEEMKGQLAAMLEMMTRMSRGKEPLQEATTQERRAQDGGCPYPHNPIPPQVYTSQHTSFSGYDNPNPSKNPSDPISVHNSDDPKEQRKLKMSVSTATENSKSQTKFDLLEERLRAIEGMDLYGSLDASELCLVPGVVIPPKFKVPEFERYDGTKCPTSHIKMYCQKMAAYAQNDELLVHTFQDSLIGSAARWYTQLDRAHVRSWKELARAFIAQYKHIEDMAPDRLSLQGMMKKHEESFREYAQRWRDVAAQVQPPLTEKETAILFVNTLPAPFYEMMVGNATKNFADMVISGEIIDNAIKSGKLVGDDAMNARKGDALGNGGHVHAMNYEGQHVGDFAPYHPYPMYQTHYPITNTTFPNLNTHQPIPQSSWQIGLQTPMPTQSNQRGSRKKRRRIDIDPIPWSYTEVFQYLLENQLVTPVQLKPLEPPYPEWYDPNARCDYHSGNMGHSIESCPAFKHKVQSLIRSGLLDFGTKEGTG